MLHALLSLFTVHIALLIHRYGYIGMFGTVFLETSIVFPLPGDSLLFTAGLFASRGFFSYPFLVFIFFVASLLGSCVAYAIGFYSVSLRKYKSFHLLLREKHIEGAHVFFEKYGKEAMLLSRFVPIVRTFAPIAAGIGKMNFGTFFRYNVAGSLLWSGIVTALGYYLGRAFPQLENYLPVVMTLVVIVSVLPAVAHAFTRKKRKQG